MVRRQIPLSRRLMIHRGRIIGFTVWCTAALACMVLYPLRSTEDKSVAMAVVRDAQVRTPEGGRLAQLIVKPGERVKAGDLLAVIEVPGLAQRVAAAEGRVAALRANAKLDDIDAARKFAKDSDASRARWLSAQVDLEAARARLAAVALDLDRLAAPGIEVPRGQVEQLQAQKVALQKEITARESEVAALRAATGSAEARAGAIPLSPLEAELAVADAELDELEARAAVLKLTAPIDGVLAQDLRLVGEWVAAGDVVGRISAGEVDQAVVYVAATTARNLKTGASAALFGTGGEELSGTIQSIGGVVEGVPSRLLPDPAVPAWGVPVTLTVTERPLIPGEALAVSF